MTTIRLAKPKKRKSQQPRTVQKSVRRTKSGRLMDVFTLNPNSPTFADDLFYVFRANVDKARRENERMFGSADGVRRRRQSTAAGSLNAVRKK